MPLNGAYSYRSFETQTLLGVDPAELSGTIIRGSGWSFSEPFTAVFPEGTTGIEFQACRLDNIAIPDGSTMDADCSNYQYQAGGNGGGYLIADPETVPETVKQEVDENGMPAYALTDLRVGEPECTPYKGSGLPAFSEEVSG